MEGHVHRLKPLVSDQPAQARLQGRLVLGRCKELVLEDDEQDDGLDQAWQREAYV